MSTDTDHKNGSAALQKKLEAEESSTDPDGAGERDTWSGKLDFIMSALSFAVGMGNLWRFPYLCYRNGGGAFLIPYIILMVLAGIPMMFLEMAFGQYGRQGVVSIWKVCPIFQGVGWAMFFVSLFTCGYYNMLNAWCIFYIAAAFKSDVPWRGCENEWNSEDCSEMYLSASQINCTSHYGGVWYNETCHNNLTHSQGALNNITALYDKWRESSKSPSDDYFHNFMLAISSGLEEIGGVRWQLALCYLFVWLIVFVCLCRGIKTSGKVTYVTALFPYFVLLILFIRGVTLEGAREGILFYLTPDWSSLASAKVWGDAAVQVFFSLSLCWGGLVTLASYNKFNNNCLRDSIVVALGDCATSIFAGVVIFAFIGYMANQMGMPVEDVATQGAGLAFIVYPQAVTTLPISPLWAVLFMLMLINVGMGTQFTLVTTVQTTLMDEFPGVFKKKHRPTLLLLAICGVSFAIGLIYCTNAGMFFLQLVDTYSATYALLILGFTLCVSLGWVYGTNNFMSDIQQMIGKRPSIYWSICWKFVTPSILLFVLIFTFVDFKRTTYGEYQFPIWSDVIGWLITITEIGSIPALALYKLYTAGEGLTLRQRFRVTTRPHPSWHHTPDSNQGTELQAKVKLTENGSNGYV